MTSPSSSLTPLGFTREYQSYRAANAGVPFPDSRLLAAVRFWVRFPDALTSDSYSSFYLEDLPALLTADPAGFEDLHPDELAEIAVFLTSLDQTKFTSALTPQSLWEVAARKWLYVGDAVKALGALERAGIASLDFARNKPNSALDLSDITSDAQLLPKALLDRLGRAGANNSLRSWLTRFDAQWQSLRETGHANQATCVLVERDVAGRPIRGRLRTLEAHIEALPKGREADEVVFGHQLCAADDPQVRGAYAALAALRLAPSEVEGIAERNPHSFLRARFTFANGGNREPYGGDSLGFACLVTAFGDLWSKDLHRERRLVSAQVALTGAINADGRAEAVSGSTLPLKVERVFFSPLSFMVIPQANRPAAEAEAARLQSLYPNRRLRILTAERATDLITDGNITIPERVCLGEYAVRAAAKYTRSTRVQVPLLIVLSYLLLCLVYPKAWVGFDSNPGQVRFTGTGITALNESGQSLWHHEFDHRHDSANGLWRTGNLDIDKENEVLCLLAAHESELTPLVGQLFAFDHDGKLMFQRSAIILGEYPGDTSEVQFYQSHLLEIHQTSGGVRVLTGASKWMPARVHFKVWDTQGNLVSWYINAGSAAGREAQREILDSFANVLHIIGINNRVNSSCLFSINLDSCSGASPPYTDPALDLGAVKPGNQLRYYVFPITDLAEARSTLYNRARSLIQETPTLFRLDVDEFGGNRLVQDSVADVMYYFDETWQLVEVRCGDAFISARNDLVTQGRLPQVDWGAYQQELLHRVRYWTDTGWANVR